MTLKGNAKFKTGKLENWKTKKKTDLACKITLGISLVFMQAVKRLKICTLMGSFCPKHIKF